MKHILEIHTPRIRGRLHHALPLSIIPEHDDVFDNWFYSNYIQLSCEREPEGGKTLNFHEAFIWDHKFPHFRIISMRRDGVRIFSRSILEIIKNSIENGYYFHSYVDEYYIGLEYYNIRHVPRDVLIHGFDEQQGTLHVAGYQRNHKFGTLEVDIHDFITAFEAVDSSISWTQGCHLYKRRTDISYRFDPVYVRELLSDYLLSQNSSSRMRGITNPHNFYYGVEAVRHYANSIEIAPHGVRVSQAPAYTLWEHKKLMYNRMQWMIEQGFVVNSSKLLKVINSYNTVIQKATTAKLCIMKHNIIPSDDLLQAAVREINELIFLEHDLLNEFYDSISK